MAVLPRFYCTINALVLMSVPDFFEILYHLFENSDDPDQLANEAS